MSTALARARPHGASFESELSAADFSRVAALVSDHTGIKLPAAKRVMVEGRLRRRASLCGFATVSDYCSHLFDSGGLDQEFQHLVDVVTTNKTDFFREPGHFTYLEEVIVPTLMGKAGVRGSSGRTIKLWSAASSNGAEAYTTAMVMADLARNHGGLRYAILGTDISSAMIDQARLAIYPQAMLDPVSDERRKRYVMVEQGKGASGRARIVPELRRQCNFQAMNLMDDVYPYDHDVDVILMRNALIYFEADVQDAVVRRLWSHLRPGGHLMLGHSESMIGTRAGLPQVSNAVFRKGGA